ncbi:hypothetical protein [Virgibacillus pantothenticus]|nr:hypothetical protein [Virgibacillus pantothenticus]
MIPLSQLIRSIRYVAKRALSPLFIGEYASLILDSTYGIVFSSNS